MNPALALLAGLLMAGGLWCVTAAFFRPVPGLQAALDRLSGETDTRTGPDPAPAGSRSDRLGASLYRLSPVRLTETQRTALQLQNTSIAEFYADKAVMAIVGAVLPGVCGFLLGVTFEVPWPVPAVAGVVGGIIGFFVPDLQLHRAAAVARSGAGEALLAFIELVTLERLTNASATQALHNAASLSEVPLFLQIRVALERARLEQQPPYAELRRLGDRLRLPELGDVADVMQLDESGAALSETLRARVRELRDAHLSRQQTIAATEAEGMTIYMTIPALIFGLIFLVAAMLRIVSS